MAIGLAVLGLTSSALAASFVWDAGDDQQKWSKAGNWTNSAAPTSSSANDIILSGSTVKNPMQIPAGAFSLNSLTFSNTAASFTIDMEGKNPGSLNFNGSSAAIIQNSTNQQAIGDTKAGNMDVVFTSDVTFGGTGSGEVFLNGTITGGGKLTLTNPNGHLEIGNFNSGVDNTIGDVIVNAGNLDLFMFDNNNAFGGALIINAGTVTLLSNGNISDTSAVTNNGGTFDLNGFTEVVAKFDNYATLTLNGGTFSATGTISNFAGGIIIGTSSNLGSVINLGTMLATNGTMTLGKGPVQSGTITIANGATLTAAQAWTNSGTINLRGGILAGSVVTNNSTVIGFGRISASITNQGLVIASNGVLTISSTSVLGTGLVQAVNGGTLRLTNATTARVVINNGGTLVVNRGTATITGGLTNFGTTAFINSIGTFNANVYNAGLWFIDPATNNFAGDLDNAGIMLLTNSVAIVGGNLINEAGAVYSMLQTSTTYVGGVFTNQGEFNIIQGSGMTNGNAFLSGTSTTLVSDAGSTWSNLALNIGTANNGGAVLIVSNGGDIVSGATSVGNAINSSNNLYRVGGLGALASVTNSSLTVGGAGGGNNSMTLTNANLDTAGVVNIGLGSSNNTVSVYSGSVWNLRSQTFSLGSGASTGNLFFVDGGTVTNTGNFTVGASSSGNNTMIATNALLGSGSVVIGSSTSNNTVTLLSNTTWRLGGTLVLGQLTATGNVLNVNGATLSNITTLTIGNGAAAVGNMMVISGGARVLDQTATIGSSSTNNTVLVTDAGTTWFNVAPGGSGTGVIRVGSGVGGGDYNNLIISNGAFVFAGETGQRPSTTIGDSAGSENNTVTVTGSGSVLSNLFDIYVGKLANSNRLVLANGGFSYAEGVYVGSLNARLTNNSVVVTDPNTLLRIAGTLVIGSNVSAVGNSVLVSNGATLAVGLNGQTFFPGNIVVGGSSGASNNSLVVVGATSSNGVITVGAGGGGNNFMIVTNSTITYMQGAVSKGLTIGSGSSNNTVTLQDDTTSLWNFGGGAITIGSILGNGAGGATGNLFNVVSTINLTNIGGMSLYDQNQSWAFSNRNFTSGGGINLGSPGMGGNTLTLTNQSYNATASSTIGNNSSNNVLTVIDSTWSNSAQTITIGTGAAISNILNVSGSLITNSGAITVGNTGSGFNSLTVTNTKITTVSTAANMLGNGTSSNTINILANSFWDFNAGSITIGSGAGAVNNNLNIIGGVLTNIGTASVSALAVGGISNHVTISSGGKVFTLRADISSTNDMIVVTDAGSLWSITGGGALLFSQGPGGNLGSVIVSNGGSFLAGSIQANQRGGGHSIIVNGSGSVLSNAGFYIGGEVVGNSLTVSDGGLVIVTVNGLLLGVDNGLVGGRSNNTILVTGSGSVISNPSGNMVIGGALSVNNSLTVTGGAKLFGTVISVGTGVGANSNSYTLLNGSSSNTTLNIGTSGGAFNTMVASNSSVWSSGLNVGANNSSNNSVTIQDGVLWNFGGGAISIGSVNGTANSGATGNLLLATTTTTLTNIGGLNLYDRNASLTFSNRNLSSAITAINLGSQGNGGNNLTLSNQIITTSSQSSFVGTGTGSSNNTLTLLANTLWNFGNKDLGIGTNGSAFNTVLISGAVVSNVAYITLGNTAGSKANSLIVSNGGFLVNNGMTVGSGQSFSNAVIVTGAGSVWSNTSFLTFGGQTFAGGYNMLSVANSGLVSIASTAGGGNIDHSVISVSDTGSLLRVGSTLVIGGSLNDSFALLIVSNGGVAVANGVQMGQSGGSNNQVIVTGAGSTLSNLASGITIGNQVSADRNSVLVTNGGYIANVGNLIIGGSASAGSTANSNNVIVTGSGSVLTNTIGITLSTGGRSHYNFMSVLNSGAVYSTAVLIGNGANTTGDYVLVSDTGSVWSVTGGNSVSIGSGANSYSNGVIIANGASFTSGSVFVGLGSGSASNYFNVVNASTSNGLIVVGTNAAAYNVMTVNNAAVQSAGLAIGVGSSNNTVTVTNSTWNMSGGALIFGSGTANSLLVDAASVMTNIGGVTLADVSHSLFFTNATATRNFILGTGVGPAGGFFIGNTPGLGNNSLTISNQSYTAGTASIIGNNSSNNFITILANTTWNNGGSNITIGTGTATGNVLTINGGTLTNVGVLNVASAAAGSGTLTLTAGSTLSLRSLIVTNNQAGGATNSFFNFTGGTLTTSNDTIGVSSIAANIAVASNTSFNINGNWNMDGGTNLTRTTSTTNNSGSVIVGNGLSNVTVTVGALANWSLGTNNGAQLNLVIGDNAAATNKVVVNGGTVTNAGSVVVGNAGTSRANSLVISNAGRFFSGNVTVGNTTGSSNNLYSVGGSGSQSVVSNGLVIIGNTGSGFNSFIMTNASLKTGGNFVLGNGSSSNTASVLANVLWNMQSGVLYVGSNTAAGNSFVLNGGTISNAANVFVGATSGSSGNSLTVSNGGVLYTAYMQLGFVSGGDRNLFNLGGLGTSSTISNTGQLDVGNNGPGIGGALNILTVSNANLWSLGMLMGNHSVDNSGFVLANAVWNMQGGTNIIGLNSSFRNSLTIDGGVLTNASLTSVGRNVINNGVSAQGTNIFAIRNGGRFFGGNVEVGAAFDLAGATISTLSRSNQYLVGGVGSSSFVSNGTITLYGYDNNMIVTNATLLSGTVTIGNFSRTNTASVMAGGLWNLQNNSMNIGSAPGNNDHSIGSVVTVNGGIITNVGSTFVGLATSVAGGAGSGNANGLVISNGGQYFGGNITVGEHNGGIGTSGANSNYYRVGGYGLDSYATNDTVIIGNGGGNLNLMTVTNATFNGGNMTVGNTANSIASVSNGLMILAGSVLNAGSINIGSGINSTNNYFIMDGGSQGATGTFSGLMSIGTNSAGFSRVSVSNAVLNTTGLTIGAGSSNNSVLVGNSLWNLNRGALTFGNGQNNSLTVDALTVFTNVGGVTMNDSGRSLFMTNATGLRNYILATTAGTGFQIGNSNGFGGNTLVISNQIYQSNTGNVIGSGSSNNTLVIFGDTAWRLVGSSGITVGSGNATGNVVRIDGGGVTGGTTLSNVFGVVVGSSAGANGNSFILTNGAILSMANNTISRSIDGSSNSWVVAGGPGGVTTLWNGNNNMFSLGQAANVDTFSNTLLISQGGVVSNIGGVSGQLNLFNVGVAQNGRTTALNQVTIRDGGQLSTLSSITIGWIFNGAASSASSNSILVDNGMVNAAGAIYIGNNSNGLGVTSFNSLTITNDGSVTSAGGFIGLNASNNFVNIAGGGAAWNLGNGALTVGSNGFGNRMTVDGLGVAGGALVTNAGIVNVGVSAGSVGNVLTVTNGGQFYSSSLTVGGAAGASNNAYNIVGASAGAIVSNGAIIIGNGGGNNSMLITNASVLSSGVIIGNAGSSNSLTVSGSGTTWDLQGGNLVIGSGAATSNRFTLNAGTVSLGSLIATSTLNTVTFNSGWLNTSGTAISNTMNNAIFRIGDGTNVAVLNAIAGTHGFQNGVLIASNSWLTGTGTISAFTAASITLTNGAIISGGVGTNGIGALNLNALNWQGGGIYQFQLTNFNGGAGNGWDLLNLTGALTNSTTGAKYVIRMDSLGFNAAQANFNSTNDYAIKIVNYSSGFGFNAANFTLDQSAWQAGGTWSVSTNGTGIYLSYQGALPTGNVFVWSNNLSSAWSTGNNWTNFGTATPTPPVNGSTTVVLEFDATNTPTVSYYANNNLVTGGNSFTNNAIILRSTSTLTNTLVGSTLTFAGGTAGVFQVGSGAFVISNVVNLATNIAFRGAGLGTVLVASNITGTGQITKMGGYNLILQGSNSFTGAVLVDSSGGTLTLNNIYALGTNSITVSNGTVAAGLPTASYIVGNGWSNQSVLITGSGSQWTNAGTFVIGLGAASSNVVTINNGATLTMGGRLTVGTNNAINNILNIGGAGLTSTLSNGGFVIGSMGSGNNTVNITNANVFSAGVFVGLATSNNTVTVMTNSLWNLLAGQINVGLTPSTGNVLLVNGGIITNGGAPILLGTGNSIVISNGGKLFTGQALAQINALTGSSNNSIVVSDTNSVWIHNNSSGLQMGLQAGTRNGSIIVSNGAAVYIAGPTVVGFNDGNQNITVTGLGSVMTNGILTLGQNGSVNSNSLTVANGGLMIASSTSVNNSSNTILVTGTGSVFSNIGALTLNTLFSSVVISNGGGMVNSSVSFGASATFITVTGQGSSWTNTGAFAIIGGGDGLTIANSGTVFAASGTISTVGGNNRVTVTDTGSLFRVTSTILLGSGAAAANNLLIISNGASVVAGGLTNAAAAGGNSNIITVVGGGALLNLNGGILTVGGNATAVSNVINVSTGGVLSNAQVFLGGVNSLFNLNGGSATVSNINLTTTSAQLSLDGGTLRAMSSTNSFISGVGTANVLAGGVTIDSAGFVIGITQSLVHAGSGTDGGLTKVGVGSLTLGGSNSYNGITTIASGQIILANTNAIAFSTLSNLVNNGLLFSNNILGATAGGLAGTGNIGLSNQSGAGVTFTVGNNGSSNTYSGSLSGTSALVVVGGRLTLAGTNDFMGATTINGGQVALATGVALTNSIVNVNSAGGLSFAGADTTYTIGGLGGNSSIGLTNASGSAITLNLGRNSATYSGSLVGGGNLFVSGTGTQRLSGASTYTGTTTITNGLLLVNNTTGSGTGSGVVTVKNGGVLSGTGSLSGLVTVESGGAVAPGDGSIAPFRVGSLNLTSGSILNFEFSTGPLTNDTLLVTTASGLTLNGGNFNLYQNGTTVNFDQPGVYQLIGYSGTLNGLGIGALNVNNATANRLYTFSLGGGYINLSIAGLFGWSGGGATNLPPNFLWSNAPNWGTNLVPTAFQTLQFFGNTGVQNTNDLAVNTPFSGFQFMSGGGAFVLTGNVVNLTGNIINFNTNVLQSVNMDLVLQGSVWELNASNGNLAINGNISETNGPLGFTKTGQNTLTLSGTNSYSGNTILQSGTLAFARSSGMSGTTTNGPIGSGSLTINGGGLMAVNAGQTISNAIFIAGDFAIGGTQSLTLAGPMDMGTSTHVITISNSNNTYFAGSMTNSGGFIKLGNGVLTLVGNSTYTGGTVLSNGMLVVSNLTGSATGLGDVLIANGTTLSMQGGIINGNPGAMLTNSGLLSGYGTVSNLIVNQSTILAVATNLPNVGTLTVNLASYTNDSASTIGTVGTNSVLNILTPGGVDVLINMGTISLSGGSVTFNYGLPGTITNLNVIAGIGDLSTFPVVNASTTSAIIAQNPIDGVSNLFATISATNSGMLGANNIGGLATLDLTVGAGGTDTLVNQGTIALNGGVMVINGGLGGLSNIVGGIIYGAGFQTNFTIANVGGTVMATNGFLTVGLLDDLNQGTLANAGVTDTLQLTNAVLVNQGNINLNGGGLMLGAGFNITNQGTINGAGKYGSSLYNDTVGLVVATNGTLSLGTNGTEFITNAGLIQVKNGGTLNIVPDWNNVNGGVVNMEAGTIMGGILTNRGLLVGVGDVTTANVINKSGGTIMAANPVSGISIFSVSWNELDDGTIGASNGAVLNVVVSGGVGSSFHNAGTISMLGGTLMISNGAPGLITNDLFASGFGTITPAIVNPNTGTILGSNGTLIVGLINNLNLGTIQNFDSSSTVRLTNTVLVNQGTIALNAGGLILSGGARLTNENWISGPGVIAGRLYNDSTGTLDATNGTLYVGTNATSSFINLGSFNIAGGSTGSVINAWVNSNGTVNLVGGVLTGATLTNKGQVFVSNVSTINGGFINAGGGTVTLTSGSTLNVAPDWLNTNGTVQLNSGTLIGGILTNEGVVTGNGAINSVSFINLSGGIVSNMAGDSLSVQSDWININGTLAMAGGSMNGGNVTNAGLITGFGTISSLVVNNSGGILAAASGTLTLSNAPLQTGTFIINNGATLNVAAEWVNSGMVNMLGGTLANANLTNSATIAGAGFIHPNVVNLSTGSIIASNGTLVMDTAQDFSQAGTLQIQSGGTLILSNGVSGLKTFVNAGTIAMVGGFLQADTVTNNGYMTGFGTAAVNIQNVGTVLANSSSTELHLTGGTVYNSATGVLGANGGRLVVDTVFTNAGTASFQNSYGTFNSVVVNEGVWMTDPTTLTFNSDFSVATNGYVSMSGSDVYSFKSNFFNASTLSNQYNTLNGKFIFDGSGGHTQLYTVAGINLGGYNSTLQSSNEIWFTNTEGSFSTNSFTFAAGGVYAGYSNNFALGDLTIGSASVTSTLELVDSFGLFESNDNKVAALYLNTLTLNPGSLLIVSNNVELFFRSTNGVTGVGLGVLGAGDNILLLSGSSFHQIAVVPEPSILLLLMLGSAAIFRYRRAQRRKP